MAIFGVLTGARDSSGNRYCLVKGPLVFSISNTAGVDISSPPIKIGAFKSSGATGNAVAFSSALTSLVDVYGESSSNLTSAYSCKSGRFRHLVSGSSMTAAQETYGLQAQVCAKGVTMTHLHAGLIGTFEGTGASVVLNSAYTMGGHACVMARPGGHANITATTPLAGFLAFNNASAALASGKLVAFQTSAYSSSYPWTYGMYMPVGSIVTGIRIGDWVGSGASGSAIAFATSQNLYSDGQLDILGVYGESTSDLTTAYSAKCGRFRHIATGSSLTVSHETYGLIGQMCGKGVTLTHLHAGLIGTFEGTGASVVLNSTSYTTGGHAAVMARIGGHANITCTTPLYGFLAWNNASATVASGTLAAFGTAVKSTSYPWPIGLYVPSGSATVAIDATVATMGASGRIAKLYGSCAAANMGDGYGAVEIDLTLSGTVAGYACASSTWVNVTGASVTAGSNTVCVRNDGIYVTSTGTPMASATAIIGGRLHYIAEGGGNPGALYLWQTNISDNVLTAMFSINAIEDLGGSSGAASSGGYKIPFAKITNSGTVYYINMYTS